MTQRRRSIASATLTLLAATIAALAATEGVLRLAGYRPWGFVPTPAAGPVVSERDPVRGWRAKPGRHIYERPDRPSPPVHMTVGADGARVAGPTNDGRPAVVLVGCSFTFGWGVSDEDTFAWKLAQRLPQFTVRNLGVIGYGTYQSLLTVEDILAAGQRPAWILYGYMDGHEVRNVAHPLWTQAILSYADRGQVAVPFCRLDAQGELRRHPPGRHPIWPLQRHLALVHLLASALIKRTVAETAAQAAPVTQQLMVEMATLCKRHGVPFGVVLLTAGAAAESRYVPALEAAGARVIDCASPLGKSQRIPIDGHPNERAHAEWADCIAAALAAASDRAPEK